MLAVGLHLGLSSGLSMGGLSALMGEKNSQAAAATSTENLETEALFAAARRDADGDFSAALFTMKGDLRSIPLPGRGHDLAARPHSRDVVVFARRPGRFAIVFSPNLKIDPLLFHAQAGRHFYGHGVFSPDGRLLFTSENDYEDGVGKIGIRDASKGYQQIGEFSSYGVGPHDLALLMDGRTLVVANGGLETSPTSGRQILNLATMEPSLVYIDTQSGDLLEKHVLARSLHQLSIRHLTIASHNRVAFGCQYKGAAGDQPALVGFHDRGSEPQLFHAPDDVQPALKNYIGSVAVDPFGDVIAASAPRGNMITFWRAADGKYLGREILTDGCGVARGAERHGFLLTSGHGVKKLGQPDLEGPADEPENSAVKSPEIKSDTINASAFESQTTRFQWDNHAVRVR
ncbi:MAG: hypothetical protein DHS20C08_18840 [Rhodomicrobium sp.]|nr:MAG: hypothetical protein DHS20C08_18840 [Rhodomicrobium sp.]